MPHFLLGFAVMAAYWPGIAGAPTTPRWIALSVGSALLLFLSDRITVTLTHVTGIIFVAWCAVTLAWSSDGQEGVGALIQMVGLVACFALGSALPSLRAVYAGCAAGLAVSSVIVTAQHLGALEALPHYHFYGGLFYNANFMGEAAALVIVACLATRLWTGAFVCLPALLLSGARAAILGVIVAGLAWVWSCWPKLGRALVIGGAGIGITALVAGYGGPSFQQRLNIWSDTARNVTLTGQGLGSYWATFPLIAQKTDVSRERPDRAHNEVLDIAYETGIVGAVLFLAFCLSLVGPLTPGRFVLITLAVEAMFGFPIRAPATAFLGMLVAGAAARDRGRIVDQARYGRDRVRAWLARRHRDGRVRRRA